MSLHKDRPQGSFQKFMDWVLFHCRSTFTIGKMEEDQLTLCHQPTLSCFLTCLLHRGSSPPRLHLGLPSLQLHQASLALWFRLGQSLLCLLHRLPGLQLCCPSTPLAPQAPPSLLLLLSPWALQLCLSPPAPWFRWVSITICLVLVSRLPCSICKVSTMAPPSWDYGWGFHPGWSYH